MEKATAQVVFLIDSDLSRLSSNGVQEITSRVALSCIRILSSFLHNPQYRQLRWGYKFYNLGSLPMPTMRTSGWKEFNIQTFEAFEEKLEASLAHQTFLVQTPRKKRKPSEAADDEEYFNATQADIYSKILCAVIEDFKWEMPDIFHSPVRKSRFPSRSNQASSASENVIFNFTCSPKSQSELNSFMGRDCKTADDLLSAIMFKSALDRWKEKNMRLIWVDSVHLDTICWEVSTFSLCERTLRQLNGCITSINSIVSSIIPHPMQLLPTVEDGAHSKAVNIVPPCNVIHSILSTPLNSSVSTSVKQKNVSKESMRVSLVYTEKEVVVDITYLTTDKQSSTESDGTTLPCKLKHAGDVDSKLVHLEMTSGCQCYLLSGGDEEFAALLVNLSKESTVQVLSNDNAERYFLLKPLTADKATMTSIRTSSYLQLEKLITFENGKDVTDSMKCYTGIQKFDVAMVDPVYTVRNTQADTCHKERKKIALDKIKISSLQEHYRKKRLAPGIKINPTCRVNNPVMVNKNSQSTEDSTDKPAKQIKLSKRSSMRLMRGLQMFNERKPSSVAPAATNNGRQEQEATTCEAPASNSESITPTRKKIKLTTVSTLKLDKEEELVDHIRQSYNTACAGESDIYLTAQNIVNTVRVFYKYKDNLYDKVESLIQKNIIKSSKDIRKTCQANTDRKIRECEISCLILLELVLLKQEIFKEETTEDDIEAIISSLEEYLTSMSVGRPEILKNFLFEVLVPSYQMMLSSLLEALLTEYGQDIPPCLKRLLKSASTTDKYAPIGSDKSDVKSPASSMLPSITSLLSEPENSLMSLTMNGGISRSLQIRSKSDLTTRRSIAVPGEILKKRRQSRRVSSRLNRESGGDNSNTSLPRVESQPLMTEFPTGFLSGAHGASLGSGLSHSLADVRRSPRLAGIAYQSSSAVISKSSARKRVKRDLFSSPTATHKRRSHPARPPTADSTATTESIIALTTPVKQSGAEMVLVAETPHHRQGRSSLTMLTAAVNATEISDDVVNESPDKQVIMESPSVYSTDGKPSNTSEETVVQLQSQPVSSMRRFGRRASFYDMESIKSRNVEKFEKFETRMKCAFGTNKVTPRRVANLIFKQAMSQPADRIATRRTPVKSSVFQSTSPLLQPKRSHRKSRQDRPGCQSESLNTSAQKSATTPQKRNLKKKLFTSPSLTSGMKDIKMAKSRMKFTSALHSNPLHQQLESTLQNAGELPSQESVAKNMSFFDHTGAAEAGLTVVSGCGEYLQPSVQKKRRRSVEPEDIQLKLDQHADHQSCSCSARTPTRKHRSPSSRALTPGQHRVCSYTLSHALPDFSEQSHLPINRKEVYTSPRKLNSPTRKRLQDGPDMDAEVSFPQLEKCGIVLRDNQTSNQIIDTMLSPYKQSPTHMTSPSTSVLLSKSPHMKLTPSHRHISNEKTTPKYSPVTENGIKTLMSSKFTS